MIIIQNERLIPKGYRGITIYPFIIVKDKLNKTLINHESIHIHQQLELLIIPFYFWYCTEYVINLFKYKYNTSLAYRNISFEVEAYANEHNPDYIKTRKPYQWFKL